MGPFFSRLRGFLEQGGVEVFKINLNGGDQIFYPSGPRVAAFTGRPRQWRGFLQRFIVAHGIEALILFGDCRFYHRAAVRVAGALGIRAYVFEEGYLRPHWITLELGGANGYSATPNRPEFFARHQFPVAKPASEDLGRAPFWGAFLYSLIYGAGSWFWSAKFSGYRHHRPYFTPTGIGLWLRSFARKGWYAWRDRDLLARLEGELSGRYFLVPLQVFDDAQVVYHSDFADVEDFIREVVATFAQAARAGDHLVIKHHPMDRGNRNYRPFIACMAKEYGVADRVLYVHDLHLPTLLKHARGTVVINSTVGLSSAVHGTPVVTLGRAMYDVPGITHQGDLASFFRRPAPLDAAVFHGFRDYLLANNQLPGSFYTLRDTILRHRAQLRVIHGGVLPAVDEAPVVQEAGDRAARTSTPRDSAAASK